MEKRFILYAEDDADDRFIFEEAFLHHRDQIEILQFSNGLELINYLDTSNHAHPSLIVLDINMPKLGGRETLKILRGYPEFRSTPIAMLTTSSLQVDADFARQHNAMFLTKSINHSQMEKITTQLLEYCGTELHMDNSSSLLV